VFPTLTDILTLTDIQTLATAAGGLTGLAAAIVVAFFVHRSQRKAAQAPGRESRRAEELGLRQAERWVRGPAAATQESSGGPAQAPSVAAPSERELPEFPIEAEPTQIERPPDVEESRAPAAEPLRPQPNGLAQALKDEQVKTPEVVEERPPGKPAPGDGLAAEPPRTPPRAFFALRRTRERFLARLRAVLAGQKQIEEICEGLEEALIEADVGVETSLKLIDAIRSRVKRNAEAEAVRQALKDEIVHLLKASATPPAVPAQPPLVVMLVGVNGVGKTTTVAKLAAYFKAERGGVIVGAADTFRAAAVEQLDIWCRRVGVDVIKHRQGGDPAAVAFDTVKAAVARGAAVALIDTAGRLQTKVNLMEELKKIARVIKREIPDAPHEVWLVLDATTGQNALSQAKLFSEAVHLTGVVLAKLDSSAKGGVVLAIADRLGLAVRFVGVGEELQDLRVFDEQEFVDGMFETELKDEQIVNSAYSG
jgi:fused signal recognition particle receptor